MYQSSKGNKWFLNIHIENCVFFLFCTFFKSRKDQITQNISRVFNVILIPMCFPMSTGSAHLYHTTHSSSAGEVQHCFPTELPLTSTPF